MEGTTASLDRDVLQRRGRRLEWATLGWNVIGVGYLAVASVLASSVALAGFGLDSLIEIGASVVVLWELADSGERRQRIGQRLITVAFVALAVYLVAQATVAILVGHHARPGAAGIVWTAATAVVMFALARGKRTTGRALGNPVLEFEGRVTFVDALLAVFVLVGITLDLLLGWWWADPLAGYVIAAYAAREVIQSVRSSRGAARIGS